MEVKTLKLSSKLPKKVNLVKNFCQYFCVFLSFSLRSFKKIKFFYVIFNFLSVFITSLLDYTTLIASFTYLFRCLTYIIRCLTHIYIRCITHIYIRCLTHIFALFKGIAETSNISAMLPLDKKNGKFK